MSSHRVVVVGTGAGGLCATAFLAKQGFEVIAFERSIHIGGLLNPYSREGLSLRPRSALPRHVRAGPSHGSASRCARPQQRRADGGDGPGWL